jgi:hypothetical protein
MSPLVSNADFIAPFIAFQAIRPRFVQNTPWSTRLPGLVEAVRFNNCESMLMHRSCRIWRADCRIGRRIDHRWWNCLYFRQYAHFKSFTLDTASTLAINAPRALRLAAPAPPQAGLLELHD